MIARIDVMLHAWGRWAMAQVQRSVGYPSICPMFKDAGGGAYGSGIPAGVSEYDLKDIDAAVRALPIVHRTVVMAHYQHAGSFRETAKKCGIGRGMLNRFLTESHFAIDRWLSDSQNHGKSDSFHSCLQSPAR